MSTVDDLKKRRDELTKDYEAKCKEIDDSLHHQIQANKAPVIKRIKEDMAIYSITAKDLGINEAKTKTTKPSSQKGTTVPPKYRSLKNPDKTWTGRGRKPQWMADYEATGGSKADCLIQ